MNHILQFRTSDLQGVLASPRISQSLSLRSYFECFPNHHEMKEIVPSLVAFSSHDPGLSKFVAKGGDCPRLSIIYFKNYGRFCKESLHV